MEDHLSMAFHICIDELFQESKSLQENNVLPNPSPNNENAVALTG